MPAVAAEVTSRFVSGVVAHRTLKRDQSPWHQDAPKSQLADLRSQRDGPLGEVAVLKAEIAVLRVRLPEHGAQSGA